MESTGLRIRELSLQNISVELVKLCHEIVRKETISDDVSSNMKTVSRLRKTYTKKLRAHDSRSVCFDSVDVRNAYIFQFCPSFTLAMASHFLVFMKSLSHQQLLRLATRDTLTICCLGGGPGTEVLAICRTLQEVRKCLAVENPLLVDAIVVDVEPGWSTTSELVVRTMSPFVDASVVKINNFRFIHGDLKAAVPDSIAAVLSQSDVITMNKFLSTLQGENNLVSRAEVLKDTWGHIPQDSILFLMDSSGWNRFEEMVRTVETFEQVELVYGPARKTSRMSKSSKRLCVELFSPIYGRQVCTAQSSNKSAAWLKTASSADVS